MSNLREVFERQLEKMKEDLRLKQQGFEKLRIGGETSPFKTTFFLNPFLGYMVGQKRFDPEVWWLQYNFLGVLKVLYFLWFRIFVITKYGSQLDNGDAHE